MKHINNTLLAGFLREMGHPTLAEKPDFEIDDIAFNRHLGHIKEQKPGQAEGWYLARAAARCLTIGKVSDRSVSTDVLTRHNELVEELLIVVKGEIAASAERRKRATYLAKKAAKVAAVVSTLLLMTLLTAKLGFSQAQPVLPAKVVATCAMESLTTNSQQMIRLNSAGDVCIAGNITAMVSGADGALQDGVDAMILATVKDYANANPLAVVTVDTNGDYVAGAGGVQYTEGDTDASITGTAALMEGAGNTLLPLQGTVAAGLLVNVSDAFALESGGNLDAITALLGTIDADTGNLAAIAASLSVLDDFDESDRAKVNIVVGQAGVTAGAGSVAANTPRVTLASDDPAVALLTTIDADTSALVALILGTQADNIANTADGLQVTNFNMVFDGSTWDRMLGNSTDGVLVNLGANNDVTVTGTVTVTDGSGALNVIVDSGTITANLGATDNAVLDDIADGIPVTNAGTFVVQIDGAALTALQLIDNIVGVEDVGETAGGGLAMVGTVRRNTAASSAGSTGDNATLNTDESGLVWARDYDPCSAEAKSYYVINVSSSGTVEIANAVANEFFYICSINVVSLAANNILVAEDDTDGCGSISAGLNGGTTAGTGWNFAANAGIAQGNGASSIMRTGTANRYLCLATSASTQTSGTISYVSAP